MESYNPAIIILGSSTAALILRKNKTASRPSIRRWSYVNAMYIIGLTTTCKENFQILESDI